MEESTKLFAEVQSAYAVLSDPQERAWYDSHRNLILREDSDIPNGQHEHEIQTTGADEIFRLLPRINGNRDFSDSPSGFYSVLRPIFDNLSGEEILARGWNDVDQTIYPSFGQAGDNYDSVVRPFYAAWSSFATKKSFSWMDMYRYSDASDRRVRRLMEKENKRLREDAVRAFNDAVRSFVAFVKKRDPRFTPNTQSEAERQKILRNVASAQATRSRAANRAKAAAGVELPVWAQSTGVEEEGISDEEAGVPKQEFECVVCKKTFKSEKQFEMHEKSKKHKKAAQQLRREIQIEDATLNLSLRHDNKEYNVKDVAPAPPNNVECNKNFSQSDVDVIQSDSTEDDGLATVPTSQNQDTLPATQEDCTNTGYASPSSDDDYATHVDIAERILSDQAPVYTLSDSETPINIVQVKAGPKETERNSKVRKAKVKRGKKAAQSVKTEPSLDVHVSQLELAVNMIC